MAISRKDAAWNCSRPTISQDSYPKIRLAHKPGAQGDNVLMGRNGVQQLPADLAPSLLVSFWYLSGWLPIQKQYRYREWVLDSGAFSARQSGATIDLERYIEMCLSLLHYDATLVEIFALDVIGDWRASLKNTERMWARGVPAIPAYHMGEPADYLEGIARDYPKIALGGMADLRRPSKKLAWASECFAHVWPKAIHGFGACSEDMVLKLPWHTVDATSWQSGPVMWGRWRGMTRPNDQRAHRLRWYGNHQDLTLEVQWYKRLEALAQHRWAREMQAMQVPPMREWIT